MRAFDSDCHSFTVQAEMLTGAHINDKYSLALSRRTNKQRHIWYVLLLVIVCTAQHQLEYEQKKANNNIKKPNETTNTQHWWNEVHNNDIDVLCWQLLQSAIITSCLLWYVIWDIIGSIHAGICARLKPQTLRLFTFVRSLPVFTLIFVQCTRRTKDGFWFGFSLFKIKIILLWKTWIQLRNTSEIFANYI